MAVPPIWPEQARKTLTSPRWARHAPQVGRPPTTKANLGIAVLRLYLLFLLHVRLGGCG
jgi:hypothetical protein